MDRTAVLQLTDAGLYCPAGDFYIDPWLGVERAIITHAHADHARSSSQRYLTTTAGAAVLRARLGLEAVIETAELEQTLPLQRARVSLHPAGHILGSAQVRVEVGGEVWVVSGDYKVEPDPTCTAFAPVRCHGFVTESTFGLPIYRWPPQAEVFADVNAWWRSNQQAGRTSLLFGYALGKAQRALAQVDASIGPIFTHGAVEKLNEAYRVSGIRLPPTVHVATAPGDTAWNQALIVAPPSAHGTPWARKFGPSSTAFLSGWMQIRGPRRRRSVDRGFVLSDHADWPGLLSAIEATGAEQIWTTHGYAETLARWLREHGRDARAVQTRFEGERDDTSDAAAGEEVA